MAECNALGCDLQQLRGELADFRQTMLADIHVMFEQQETNMRQLFRRPSVGQTGADSGSVVTQAVQPCSPSSHFSLGQDAHVGFSMPPSPAPFTAASSEANGMPLKDRNGETLHAPSEAEDVAEIKNVTGVFGDLGTMDKINLSEKAYDVTNFYKTKGFAQFVARHRYFDNFTLAVICANAIYLGVDADNNTAGYILDSDIGFQICEHVFCVYFTTELVFRFASFQHKRNCLKDGWFKFDSALVVMMVAETWIMPAVFSIIGGQVSLPTGPLRLLRLLRLSRLVRLIRTLPELLTMFKGMFVASRAVGSSLLMVLLLIYVFGIIVHMGSSKEEGLNHKLGTLPRCMWTLLMDGTFMDSTGSLLTNLIERGKFNTVATAFVFLTFILLSAMTVMNMLIGVLCEVVSAVAQGERDEAAIKVMKETILVELKQFDKDGNGNISKGELTHVMKNKQALAVLRSIDVGADCLSELQQMLFYDKPDDAEVSIDRVMELLLQYRGNLQTTVKHMVEAHAFNRWCLTHQMKVTDHHLQNSISQLNNAVCYVASHCQDLQRLQASGHEPAPQPACSKVAAGTIVAIPVDTMDGKGQYNECGQLVVL